MIRKNEQRRLGFGIGRASALRSTSETLDQVQERLDAECRQREQHAFNEAQLRKENSALLEELAERTVEPTQVRYELARRDSADAFKSAPIPSETRH